MTADDSKYYLDYLNKLIDQYNKIFKIVLLKKNCWCWLFCFDWRN